MESVRLTERVVCETEEACVIGTSNGLKPQEIKNETRESLDNIADRCNKGENDLVEGCVEQEVFDSVIKPNTVRMGKYSDTGRVCEDINSS